MELALLKVELLDGMSYGLESNKRPGRYKRNARNLGNCSLVGYERRTKAAVRAKEANAEAERDPNYEDERHNNYRSHCDLFAVHAQSGYKEDGYKRKDCLAKIHVVFKQGIQVSELEEVPYKELREQG